MLEVLRAPPRRTDCGIPAALRIGFGFAWPPRHLRPQTAARWANATCSEAPQLRWLVLRRLAKRLLAGESIPRGMMAAESVDLQTCLSCRHFCWGDDRGGERGFPGAAPALICFVKEDRPTCDQVMPLPEALHLALGDAVDFFVVGQTLAGNRALKRPHGLFMPLLDDSALKVSYAQAP